MLQELCCRDGAAVTVLQGRCAAAASRANPGLSAGRGANGRSVGLTARVKRCAAAAAAAAAGPPSPSPSRPAPLFLAQALPPLPSPPLHHARKLAPCPSPPHRCLSVPRPYPPTIRLPLPHFPRPTASPGQLLLPPPRCPCCSTAAHLFLHLDSARDGSCAHVAHQSPGRGPGRPRAGD